MNRREAFRGIALGAAVSTASIACGAGLGVAVADAILSPEERAAERDPALVAIERHRVARAAFDAADEETDARGYQSANDAEWEAWEALTQTVPTSLAGLATMAAYVERNMTRADLPFDLGAGLALLNIAAGAAALEART